MSEKLPILTVSELNKNAQSAIEQQVGRVCVTGEISNWVQASSGHCYFSLKDDQAQVRCACFRSATRTIRFKPGNGLAVVVQAKASLYPARGDYQLIVDKMEKAGEGQLAALFNLLKKKLKAAGLFDREKKQLPAMPEAIGIITSPTGAAIEDIKKVLGRRFPLTPLYLFPSLVQGDHAAKGLIAAINYANELNHCDVLILARGGGSIEDLWPFNDEQLAHVIAQSNIPIISGVGHESDFTIADYVADVRAATPSAAAEQTVPDQRHILSNLSNNKDGLIRSIHSIIIERKTQLNHLKARLKHPSQLLLMQGQTLNHLEERLKRAMQRVLEQRAQQLLRSKQALNKIPLLAQAQRLTQTLKHNQQRLLQICEKTLQSRQQQLEKLVIALNLHNPLNIIAKGYTVLSNIDGKTIYKTDEVNINDSLTATLSDGELQLTVKAKELAKK